MSQLQDLLLTTEMFNKDQTIEYIENYFNNSNIPSIKGDDGIGIKSISSDALVNDEYTSTTITITKTDNTTE